LRAVRVGAEFLDQHAHHGQVPGAGGVVQHRRLAVRRDGVGRRGLRQGREEVTEVEHVAVERHAYDSTATYAFDVEFSFARAPDRLVAPAAAIVSTLLFITSRDCVKGYTSVTKVLSCGGWSRYLTNAKRRLHCWDLAAWICWAMARILSCALRM
jgi:hypothetical protein